MATEPVLPSAPRDLVQVEQQDGALVFPVFTAQTAWVLGVALRTKLLAFAKPAVVDISLAQGDGHCLFHCTTHSGTTADNDVWVRRKRNAVLRWACSTWLLNLRFGGDLEAFAAKFALGATANQYAIHGGGWPIRVKGVEGIVAVVVVSGLKQDQDHAIIVQTIAEMLEEMGMDLEKKKED